MSGSIYKDQLRRKKRDMEKDAVHHNELKECDVFLFDNDDLARKYERKLFRLGVDETDILVEEGSDNPFPEVEASLTLYK